MAGALFPPPQTEVTLFKERLSIVTGKSHSISEPFIDRQRFHKSKNTSHQLKSLCGCTQFIRAIDNNVHRTTKYSYLCNKWSKNTYQFRYTIDQQCLANKFILLYLRERQTFLATALPINISFRWLNLRQMWLTLLNKIAEQGEVVAGYSLMLVFNNVADDDYDNIQHSYTFGGQNIKKRTLRTKWEFFPVRFLGVHNKNPILFIPLAQSFPICTMTITTTPNFLPSKPL